MDDPHTPLVYDVFYTITITLAFSLHTVSKEICGIGMILLNDMTL